MGASILKIMRTFTILFFLFTWLILGIGQSILKEPIIYAQMGTSLGDNLSPSDQSFKPLASNSESEKIDFTINQTSGQKNHNNSVYNFEIDYPQNWIEEDLNNVYDIGEGKTIFKIGAPTNNPDSMRTSANTVISIDTADTSRSLNPNTLQVESLSPADYAKMETNLLSGPMDFGGMQATHDITRNNTTEVSGLPSWRIDYITNISGIQSSYQSKVFVVNEGTLFTIDFFTDPLKVPETLPIFEQVLKSFKFTA